MLCPVCKNAVLYDKELELGLKGHTCNQCSGNWVRFHDYMLWKEESSKSSDLSVENQDYNLAYDNRKANFCPDCGRILIKYKVSGAIPFYVDHCAYCNGLWLDKCEWEAIVGHNLQYQVNVFFTSDWQKKIRKEMTAQRFRESYSRKFGEDNYAKLKEIRKWIVESNQKGEILAYLIDEDPYRI
jgi:Zn-finger nucleic acid-binding protein